MGIDLRTTTAAVPLERDVIRVEGPEAVDFLQGQLSQDLAGLAVGASTATLLLQPTGKAVAWLRATRLADETVALDVDAGAGEAVRARLARFKLRTKADLELLTRHGWAVRGPAVGELPVGALAIAWPGVEGFDLLADDDAAVAGIPVAAPADLEALRIECGVPATGTDLTEDTIPAEAGQWLIDASVSFTKGCYTGQELVARIDSRGGNVPRPLRGLVAEGALTSGAAVTIDGSEVGHVTSAAESTALGWIGLGPLARSVELDAVVDVAGVTARVRALPDAMSRRLLAAVLALGLLAACTGDHDADPKPRPGSSTTSTTAVDRSGIALRGVDGATTSTIPTTGRTHLTGTVAGPGGLIPGATVRIERLQGGAVQRTDVATGPDGHFDLAKVPGGRYRVRAFLAPTLAQEKAVVAFLEDGKDHEFKLTMEDERGLTARAAVAPSPPIEGRAVNLAVLLLNRVVDPDGIVRTHPVTGVDLQLLGLGRLVLHIESTTTTDFDPDATFDTSGSVDDGSARTDGAGVARWALDCVEAGKVSLSIDVPIAPPPPAPTAAGGATTTAPAETTTTAATASSQILPLDLPACVTAASLTTTTAAGASTTAP